ncbi:unnamed protein product, partial [Aphanomyces euteiches]
TTLLMSSASTAIAMDATCGRNSEASISSPWPCNVVRFTRRVTLPTSSVTRPVLPRTLLQPRIWTPSSPRSGTRMRSLSRLPSMLVCWTLPSHSALSTATTATVCLLLKTTASSRRSRSWNPALSASTLSTRTSRPTPLAYLCRWQSAVIMATPTT